MKKRNGLLMLAAMSGLVLSQPACKPKKVLVNESIEVAKAPTETREEQRSATPVTPVKQEAPTPVQEAPNYNFSRIQFELDSYVLKTESYAVLDRISREMKKDPNVRFTIYGHASVEGTADYNMKLSVDRGNAVKIYLVNAGVNTNNLTTIGKGATEPIASNDSESGRAMNRRVEIKVNR